MLQYCHVLQLPPGLPYGTGVAGGGAVCRHEFGQRVDIIRAKHNRCLNNPNLGSVTAGNGNNSATPENMDPGKCLLLPPPPLNPFGQNSVCPPPKWMLARTPMYGPPSATRRHWQRFICALCGQRRGTVCEVRYRLYTMKFGKILKGICTTSN